MRCRKTIAPKNLGSQAALAREGTDHSYQYQLLDETPVAGGEYTFDFKLDAGQYCVIVQFVDSDGANVGDRWHRDERSTVRSIQTK